MPPESARVEWAIRCADADVECHRRLLPPGVIELTVMFRGIVVAAWTTTAAAAAAEWAETKRRAWQAVADRSAAVPV